MAHLQERGVDLHTVHLHGADIVRDSTTPYFVGFNLRYFRSMLRCFEEEAGIKWIEVVHPTAKHPLTALRCRPLEVEGLAARRRSSNSSFFR